MSKLFYQKISCVGVFYLHKTFCVFALVYDLSAELQKQEAQLSRRYRAMLRVIEYLATSLKVIRNDSVA